MKLQPKVQVLVRIEPDVANDLREVVAARNVTVQRWVENAIIRQLEAEKAAE